MNKKMIIGAVALVVFLVGCGASPEEQEPVLAEPEVPVVEDEVVNDNVPEGCITWFDGCNNCSVGEPGMPMACTMMACAQMQEPYCAKYEDGSSDAPIEMVPVSTEVEEGIKNSTYDIEGQEVILVDGKAEVEAAPGSATKIITQTTEYMAEGDLQQDTGTTLDGAVVLTQYPGGSGTFYYVGATLLQTDGTYVAAEGTYLLGDRITIKEIKIDEHMIYVTYLERGEEASMADVPTVEVSKQYATNGNMLIDVTPTAPVTQEGVTIE